MRLNDLVPDVSSFLDNYWKRNPALFKHQIAPESWPDFRVENLSEWFDKDQPHHIVLYKVDNGELFQYDLPILADGSLDMAEVIDGHYNDGVSITINKLHKRREWARSMATDLLKDFKPFGYVTVGTNVFVTPPNSQAVKAHVDPHQIFVVQLMGTKRWLIGEDRREIVIEAGDVFYLPKGCLHEARTDEVTSIHETLGIYTLQDVEETERQEPKEGEGDAK